MRSVALVIWHEIRVTLSKRVYWIMTFLLPAFILIGTFIPQIVAGDSLEEDPLTAMQSSIQHIGVVDAPGLIQELPPGLPSDLIIIYDNEAPARADMTAGELDQLFIMDADFVNNGGVTAIGKGNNMFSNLGSEDLLSYIVAYNLTGDPATAALLVDPLPRVTYTDLASPTKVDHGDDAASSFVPFIMMFVLFFVITITAGFMLQSVAKEKENRTMEVLLLSLSPKQLMLGKVLGLGSVALVQMMIWMLGARTALMRSADLLSLPADLTLPISYLALVLVFFLLGYFLYAAMLGMMGALAPNVREGTQFTFIIIFPLLLPLWLNSIFSTAPNGTLAVILSLIPFTAPTGMVARMAITTVPAWQVVLSLLGLLATTYFFVSLAARFFRADVLLSARSLHWRRLQQEIRGLFVAQS